MISRGEHGHMPEIMMLAERVADHGIPANEADVQRLVALARRLGIRGGAVDALGDPCAVEVLRTRALTVVLSELRRIPGS
jgi:hypothetical protein